MPLVILYMAAYFLQMTGRKLLHQLSANTSTHDQLSRKDQHEGKTLAPAKVAIAISGVFLLCCALMCPCFRSKKKEPIEQNIMSTEMDSSESNRDFSRTIYLSNFCTVYLLIIDHTLNKRTLNVTS